MPIDLLKKERNGGAEKKFKEREHWMKIIVGIAMVELEKKY